MQPPIYSGAAQVAIQGPRALRFLQIKDGTAEFEIIGLSDPRIEVIDSRPEVVKTMAEIEKTKEVEKLAPYFNKPARVTISTSESGKMRVELKKTRAQKPRYMLWVAIGIDFEAIPYYRYVNVQIQRMEDQKFALFSLYRRPKPK